MVCDIDSGIEKNYYNIFYFYEDLIYLLIFIGETDEKILKILNKIENDVLLSELNINEKNFRRIFWS